MDFPPPPPWLGYLTERQFQVLELLAKGCTTQQIGRRLVISVDTAKCHRAAIYRRLGVQSAAEAVDIAHRAGWLK